MKRFALCTLVAAALVAPQPTRAQSCSVASLKTCALDFGGGWLSGILADYCGLVRAILCEVGY